MNEETLKELKKLLNKTRGATLADLEDIIITFTSVVKDLKTTLEKKSEETLSSVEEHKGQYSKDKEHMDKCMSDMEDMIKEIESSSKEHSNKEISTIYDKIKTEIQTIKDSIPTMPDLSDIDKRIIEVSKKIEDMDSEEPEELEAEEVRDSLESIEVEEEKLKIEAIGFLRRELDEIKARLTSISTSSGKTVFGGSGGRAVRSYDLSSQLNGVTKTFNLPAMYRIISVHSSSTPFTLRQTTDYTWTTTSITFTSAITASTTLATGQSITIVYSEA